MTEQTHSMSKSVIDGVMEVACKCEAFRQSVSETFALGVESVERNAYEHLLLGAGGFKFPNQLKGNAMSNKKHDTNESAEKKEEINNNTVNPDLTNAGEQDPQPPYSQDGEPKPDANEAFCKTVQAGTSPRRATETEEVKEGDAAPVDWKDNEEKVQ